MKIFGAMVLAVGLTGSIAQADVYTFDDPVVTASTPTPGAWYTDRYAPQVFENTFFDGDNRLLLGLRNSGVEGNRGSQNGAFYNYQGRKLDMPSGMNAGSYVSVDMFADSTWQSGVRSGMWTTMSNGNLTYPILEYVVDGDNGDGNGSSFTGFRYWQSGIGWTEAVEMDADDSWYTFNITLTSSSVVFDISAENGSSIFSTSVDNMGADSIDNIILQGHNQGLAGEYNIYYDNLTTGIVPSPGVMALLGCGGLTIVSRRRR